MFHFLLIVLALLAVWKLLGHGRANGASLITGLRRLSLVAAIGGASLGGLIGFYSHSETSPGGAMAGVVIGFTVVWAAAMVVIWIVKGFLAG